MKILRSLLVTIVIGIFVVDSTFGGTVSGMTIPDYDMIFAITQLTTVMFICGILGLYNLFLYVLNRFSILKKKMKHTSVNDLIFFFF